MQQSIHIQKIIQTSIFSTMLIALTGSCYFLLRISNTIGFPLHLTMVTLASLFVLSTNRIIFWVCGFPLILLASLYMPTAIMYGLPSTDIVTALFYSNPLEAQGFLSVISIKEYTYAFALLICGVLFGYLYQRHLKTALKIKISIISCIVLLTYSILPILSKEDWKRTYPFGFYSQVFNVYTTLKENQFQPNNLILWQIKQSNPQYDDYVIVIGESVRKDYLSAYGYAHKTSPFLESTNGILIDGLISPASSTIPSLTRMLTLTGQGNENTETINYRYNLIDLANKAGFETHWISAQGKYGSSESPISILGQKSHFHFFAKLKSFGDKGPSDWELFPIFQTQLSQQTKKPRLFVVHLFGSHFNSCDRIEKINPQLQHSLGHNYNCYLSSLEQTDLLLSKIHDSLQHQESMTNRRFSMMYFADHGQGQHEALRHDNDVKQGYEVPLFVTNSDSKQHEVIKAQKSGFNMMSGLANWLNIQTQNHAENYDLFSTEPDQNILVKGSTVQRFNDLADDPAKE